MVDDQFERIGINLSPETPAPPAMSASGITRRDDGPVAVLVIDRPQVRNAIDTATMAALEAAVRGIAVEPEVRVIVITGAGDVAFSAGGDMREMQGMTPLGADQVMAVWQTGLDAIERSPKPVIAAVNGFAYGGGTELALACHIRVASSTARFGQTEIAHDHIPGGGGTQRLPRIIPLGLAYEHLLLGDPIPAEQALAWGLVNHVWAPSALMDETLALARRIAARAPVAVRYTLDAVREGLAMPLSGGLRLERALASLVLESGAAHDGFEAFFGRRGGSRRDDQTGD